MYLRLLISQMLSGRNLTTNKRVCSPYIELETTKEPPHKKTNHLQIQKQPEDQWSCKRSPESAAYTNKHV